MITLTSKYDRFLLYFLAVGTVFLIPFVQTSGTMDPNVLIRFCLLGALIVLLSIPLILRLTATCPETCHTLLSRAIFPSIILFSLITYLSFFSSHSFSEWIFEALKTTLFFAFIFEAVLVFLLNREYLLLFSKFMIINTIILGIIGLLQYYFNILDFSPSPTMPHGLMWHRNQYAEFLFLSSSFIVYGFLRLPGYWRHGAVVSLILCLYNIIISTTRSVWLAIVVSGIFCVVMSRFTRRPDLKQQQPTNRRNNKKKKSAKTSQTELYILIAVLVLGIALATFVINNVELRTGDNGRLNWWINSVKMILDHPLLGVGAGNWKIIFPLYGYRTTPETVAIIQPHNDYIWILAEIGIFGFIFYISIYIFALYYIYHIRKLSDDAESRLKAMVMCFVLVGYAIFSFFCYPRERIEHTVYLALILAVIIETYHSQFNVRRRIPSVISFSILISTALLSLLAIYDGFNRIHSENQLKDAHFSRRNLDYPEIIDVVDKVINPFYTVHRFNNPLRGYTGYAHVILGEYPKAIEDFEKALEEFPYNVKVLNNLAFAYSQVNNYDKAIACYKKSLMIFPDDEDVQIALADVYYMMGDFENTFDILIKLDPTGQSLKILKFIETHEKLLEFK